MDDGGSSVLDQTVDIKDFLVSRGYKISYDSIMLRMNEFCDWVAYGKLNTDKLCLCNDKPPQIVISHNHGEVHGHKIDNYTVEVVNENNIGWVNLEYYNVTEDELFNKLTNIEKSLTLMWENSFVGEGFV